MTRLHQENFRHLTGLGRDMFERVEWVLGDWKIDVGAPVPTGNLLIVNDFDIDEFSYEFCPSVERSTDRFSVGGIKTERLLELTILVRRNDLCEIIGVPLLMVLANTAELFEGSYQVYQHDFIDAEAGLPVPNACYIGITKRGWRKRWSEHSHAAKSGSHYRFHKAIREWYGVSKSMAHSILACGLSERQAMAYEEDLVGTDTLYPRGLNMVPGGNKGLAYLRKIGAIGPNERVAPDDRQDIINRFFERASRKGLPNPLAAANWLNPEYAESVICAGPDRLKPQQIRDMRFLSSLGQTVDDIASQVGARNVSQVQRVLAGSTYSRIL